ncbi:MAG: LLM class flavin-dependent oxidoreductase [Porticoccaceae bacterium]|nr:LLM class flavin-dependent oxidoreductase [Porticoccaceae bacterium]
MTKFSLLDLCPVTEGNSVADALRNSLDLARHAEDWGYHRYWVAEHHNMPGIASAATAVVIGHIAAGTSTIKVGAGGIMLPNHSPLVIAEQFGTLEALFPGRIELGLGRAPGTDQATAYALRRNLNADIDQFPQDVVEILGYFSPSSTGQKVCAVPGQGANIPVWILGSSTFGAQLAAALGLPYAFASHFAPDDLLAAVQIYRKNFRPSAYLDKPYVMTGFTVMAAETDDEAQYLASSMQQGFLNLRLGRPGKFPPPKENFINEIPRDHKAILDHVLACSAIGSAATVAKKIAAFMAQVQPDELIITGNMYHHETRLRSFQIAAEVIQSLN